MDYQETIDFLFAQLPVYQRDGKAAYKANLDNTLALDEYFGHPHKQFKTIHVAGTNGKGSVSHMLASILQEAGLKTGLYTSPHLLDFRERIKINGQFIAKDEVVEFIEDHKTFIAELKPSFFEMTVAMAFDHFARQKVDVAIIEVGMGGRLDSTNIIKPLLSIITNIGLDHTAFLGSTRKEIAIEKAGIIKPNVPVIIGEYTDETYPVFEQIARDMDSFICFSQRRFKVRAIKAENEFQEITVKNEQSGTTFNISLDLLGKYQMKNVIPVFGALQILVPHFNIAKEAITIGLSKVICNTNLLGRWQVLSNERKVICDTAHNKEGLGLVIEQLRKETFSKLHMVFGTVNDKDVDSILNILPKEAAYYFCKADIPRSLDSKILSNKAIEIGLNGNSYDNVKHAYQVALGLANATDLIFVGGSTFIVADLLLSLEK